MNHGNGVSTACTLPTEPSRRHRLARTKLLTSTPTEVVSTTKEKIALRMSFTARSVEAQSRGPEAAPKATEGVGYQASRTMTARVVSSDPDQERLDLMKQSADRSE